MKVMTREHPKPDTKESGRKIRAGGAKGEDEEDRE
jgi:hypothetical protein